MQALSIPDFFLGGFEAIGDEVSGLIFCYWILRVGDLFDIKVFELRLVCQTVLNKRKRFRTSESLGTA